MCRVSYIERDDITLNILSIPGHLLGITLMGTNGYLHPSIMYGTWSEWNGTPMDEAPLFYNGLTEHSADILSAASDEVVAIAKGLRKLRTKIIIHFINSLSFKSW